jgi:sugar lactone lactonase YvrE
LYGGGEVRRFGADGAVSGRVDVPAANVTACCFAGDRLFVTAREGLFALDVPYSGPPARPFGGPLVTP